MIKNSTPILVSILTLGSTLAFAQTTSVWQGTGESADWSNAANWSNGVPSSNADTAIFRNDEGAKNVNLGSDLTLNTLQISRTGTMTSPFTINGAGRTITFDKNNGTAWYNSLAVTGNVHHRINANVRINNSAGGGSYTNILLGQSGVTSKLTISGTLTASTNTNFGGYSGSELELTGNIVNSSSIRFGQSGIVTINGSGIASGTGSVIFHSGVVNLNRTSSIAGGTLSSNGVTVNFNADNAVNATGRVTIGGASAWNFNDADQSFGQLFLNNAAASLQIVLDGSSNISFLDSSALAWTGLGIDITGFTAGVNSVRFGTDASSLTEQQLQKITVNGMEAMINEFGYLTAIPEPGTWAAIIAGGAALGVAVIRRRR